MEFEKKTVLVCGMAKSGVSSAKLLNKLCSDVTVQDIKEEEKLVDLLGELKDTGIKLYLGKNPDEIISEFDLVVMSPGIPCDLPFVEKANELGIPVWGEMELAYKLCPCDIIGITGTNGKTTTTALVGEIMQNFKSGCEVVGNIGIPFTEKVLKLTKDDYVIAEVSSFQLETIHDFKVHISAVLNITPDHLNRHKTLEKYIEIKERIFKNQGTSDYTILNYDDTICKKMSEKTKGKVIFFSTETILEEGVYINDDLIHVKLFDIDEDILNINKLQIFGNHNYKNVLASVAIAVCANVPINIITQALKDFKGVEHRIEFVTEINGISFYNDSKATNVDSAIKSVEAMTQPIVLICGGYDKNADFSEWVKLFSKKVKHIIVLGEVSEQIIETCRAYNYNNYDKVNSLKDAVELSFAKASPGDCILLSPACASYDMFDNYEQRGTLFKEFVMGMRG